MRNKHIITFIAAAVFVAAAINAGTTPPMTKRALDFPGVPDRQIVLGTDGNLWVIESAANKLWRVNPSGTSTAFNIPTANAGLSHITNGPDGNIWFTENSANKVGRITPDGVITEFALSSGRFPVLITGGTDGNVWFSEFGRIGKISTADGKLTEYSLPAAFFNTALGTGPDGNVWLARDSNQMTAPDVLVRISSSGAMTEFPLPMLPGSELFDDQLISGPDGNIWFTYGNNIARATRDGKIALYPIPTPDSDPWGVTIGNDGNIWFTEYQGNKIGQLVVSTATDSGQATINESDAVDPFLRSIVMLPGSRHSSSTAPKIAIVIPPGVNCSRTFVLHEWSSEHLSTSRLLIVELPEPQACADIDVMLKATPGVGISAKVGNFGPDPAENVRSRIDFYAGAGLQIIGATADLGGTCSNTKDSISCTWPTIAVFRSSTITIKTQLGPNGDWAGRWDAIAFATTPDPSIIDNHDSLRFNNQKLKFEPVTFDPFVIVATHNRYR
jgi:streptogramin lyase